MLPPPPAQWTFTAPRPHGRKAAFRRVSAYVYAQSEAGPVNTSRMSSGVQVKDSVNMELKEIRCRRCNKLLAKADAGELEIKCPRCGAYNILKAVSINSERPERLQEDCYAESRQPVQRGWTM